MKKTIKTKIDDFSFKKGFDNGYQARINEFDYFSILCIGFSLGLVFIPALDFFLEEKPIVTPTEVCQYLGYNHFKNNYNQLNLYICYNTPENSFVISNDYYYLIEDYLLKQKLVSLENIEKGDKKG